MPKDLSKLPHRDLADLVGAEDDDLVDEQWWTHELPDNREVEQQAAS